MTRSAGIYPVRQMLTAAGKRMLFSMAHNPI